MTLTYRINEAKINFFKDIKAVMTDDDVYNVIADLDFTEEYYTPKVWQMLDELFNYDEEWFVEFFEWLKRRYQNIEIQL